MCSIYVLFTYLFIPLAFGQVFCNIGVYETQKSASMAFTNFGNAHM